MSDRNLSRMFAFGHGVSCERLPFSDPSGDEGEVRQLRSLNRQLRTCGNITANNFDMIVDIMIKRQGLFISDAAYEVHCEMGSQVRENEQLDKFRAQLTELQNIKAAGAKAFFSCELRSAPLAPRAKAKTAVKTDGGSGSGSARGARRTGTGSRLGGGFGGGGGKKRGTAGGAKRTDAGSMELGVMGSQMSISSPNK